MFAYIRGKLAAKQPTFVALDVQGVGYHLNISLNTYSKIEKNEEATLFTYLHVKEDSLTLYGFSDLEERDLFIRLISVSGIGPSTAQIILSSMTVQQVQIAILQNHPEAFKKVKGVGPKTAQRLILDLRDKIRPGLSDQLLIEASGGNTMYSEALSALVTLGFPRSRIEEVLSKIHRSGTGGSQVEELIKMALKELS